MSEKPGLGKCDCCNKEPSIGVAALPGMPMSIAWCTKCLQAEVIPIWAAISNTACIGGMNDAAQWWIELIERSLKYHNYSRDQFDANVAHEIATMDQILTDQEHPNDHD